MHFQERQVATKILQGRPDAVPALRDALRATDAETRRRVDMILDYHNRAPLRTLEAAAKEGRVDQVIKMAVEWPAGKYEDELWFIVRNFGNSLVELQEKQEGRPFIEHFPAFVFKQPLVQAIAGDRISETTPCKSREHWAFVRGGEVDLDDRRNQPENIFARASAIVSLRSVRIFNPQANVIFASGNVELEGRSTSSMVILSGGEVVVKCDLCRALIIARGKVTFGKGYEGIAENRVISGKTVTCKSRHPNFIVENEMNPLGFIRWEEPPKEKATPKSK